MTTAEKNVYDIITTAISQRNMITFTYTSQNGMKQLKTKIVNVEPFLVGEHKTTLNLILSAYYLPTPEQIINNNVPDWKLYLLANITDVGILDIPFATDREKYTAKPSMMSKVLCCIPE